MDHSDDFLDAITYITDDIIATSLYADSIKYSKFLKKLTIENVVFNGPATIVFWSDGTKTVVKCAEDDYQDPEKGLAMAIVKKCMGNCSFMKKWIKDEEPMEPVHSAKNINISIPVPETFRSLFKEDKYARTTSRTERNKKNYNN